MCICYNICMLKTKIQIKKIVIFTAFVVFIIPSIVLAGSTGSSGSGSWGGDSGWSDWDYGSVYNYTYTPNYSYDNSLYYPSYYQPSYNSYDSYSSSYYPSYTPSYSSYIPSYSYDSYSSSYIPSYGYEKTTSSTTTNTNINTNNIYVYTNPNGNAVINNPSYVNLTGYCNIVPSNPKLGQTVTATAYASGGIGNYTYNWGGDLLVNAYGSATSFTSYTPGTKNITVTIRSGQDVVTRTCSVTFENTNYYAGYSSSVTSGTPVSGIYMQKVTSGTPISGVYLNDLPETGLSLNFVHYMIISMVVILALVFTFIIQSRKRLISENM